MAAQNNMQSTLQEIERGDMLGGRGRVQSPWDVSGKGVKAGLAWPCDNGCAKPHHPGTGSTPREPGLGKHGTSELFGAHVNWKTVLPFLPVDVSL